MQWKTETPNFFGQKTEKPIQKIAKTPNAPPPLDKFHCGFPTRVHDIAINSHKNVFFIIPSSQVML